MIHLIFITGNPQKRQEIVSIIDSKILSIVPEDSELKFKFHFFDIDVPEIQSTSTIEVSKNKVRVATTLMNNNGNFAGMYGEDDDIYILVEDTGFYCQTKKINNKIINHSGSGFPGALIKFYMNGLGTTEEANQIFCMEYGDQSCYVETTVSIMHFKTNKVLTVSKQDFGKVANIPQNNTTGKSFGWDPLFIPNEINGQKNKSNISYAQMTKQQKNMSSMRKNAFSEAIQVIYTKVLSDTF
jgi:inosine/xanthosine triphosphate pyrophosphatase family protein